MEAVWITTGTGEMESLPLEKDRYTLGRSRSNDLCYIDEPRLSRHHLALERDGEGWRVEDMGSRNGTFLNGERLEQPARLKWGDRIEAGQLLLIFDRREPRLDESVVFVPEKVQPTARTTTTTLQVALAGAGEARETEAPAPVGRVPLDNPAVQALVRAGRELAGHRPLEELFRVILDLSIQAVRAERGLVMVLEGEDLVVRARHGEGFRISTAVRDRVLETRTSLLVEDTSLDEALRARQSINLEQTRTIMVAPLQTEDQVVGLIYVDSGMLSPPFTPDDLTLLTVLANVAATRIARERLLEIEQNQRLIARDLERAAEIQRNLLPEAAPEVPGLSLAAESVPSRAVGGDYYDFFPAPDGRVATVLGDVSGKGIAAALLMTGLQARVQVLAEEPDDLAALMQRLNRILAANCPINCFISFVVCLIDPAAGTMRYCNAGHNPPFLVRASGEVERLEVGGPVLGVLPQAPFEAGEVEVGPGDLVFLYSDGLSEAVDTHEEEFGEERLTALLIEKRGMSAPGILEAVKAAAAAWTAGTPPFDDMTMVVASMEGPPPDKEKTS